MPLSISSTAIAEKNKITSTGAWIILLEILYPGESAFRICLNNTTVTWNSQSWLPAIFSLSGISETKDAEVPSITLAFYDFNRNIIPIIEQYDGGVGATIVVRVVHSDLLAETTPLLEETLEIIETTIDSFAKITFKLGAENLSNRRCPQQRYLKNNCRFKFKGSDGRCGYSGAATTCDRSFANCKSLGNKTRFGGFPGVGNTGYLK